jgi:hypothetical protein
MGWPVDFHVTIDFFDDLFYGRSDWNEPLLRRLVAGFADRGVSVVHWIDYGGISDGGWDAGSYFDPEGKGQRFIRSVPDPLSVVCDEAHRRGMQAWSVLKMHDLALGLPYASFPLGSGPQPPVGLPHIGGTGAWALRWLREHPDILWRLHPALLSPDSGRPIHTIRLWHESAVAPDPMPELSIWVSQDNGAYRPYRGPLQLVREVRTRCPPLFAPAPLRRLAPEGRFFCIEFSGLDIREPFLCLHPRQPVALANTLAALLEVHDSQGDPVAVTYGMAAYQPYGQAGHDWRQVGIAFDTSRRTLLPGRGKHYSAGRARFSLADRLTGSPNGQVVRGGSNDGETVILGLARGRNEFLSGLVDVAHPSVRTWMLTRMEKAVQAGADAIDIRCGSHAETLDWENYGFGKPALAEFRRRYGVNPATQPFDRRAWQELQGEYFDGFVEQAATFVHAQGKKFCMHLLPVMEGSPDWPGGVAFHNQRWNWRRWLENGWLDCLTLKGCQPGQNPFVEAMSLCCRHGQSTILNNKAGGTDPETSWLTLIGQASAAGLHGFNLYESASLVRLDEQGALTYKHPRLWRRVSETASPSSQRKVP